MRSATFGRLDIVICNAGFGYYGTVEDTPPEIMRRMMDVNFLGTYYGARAALPGLPAPAARPSDLHLLDRRPARHSADERLQRDQGGAGRLRRVAALRVRRHRTSTSASVYPVSTETEFRSAMERDYGYTVSGLGPKQRSAQVAAAIVRCIERPRAEVYPHPTSRALAVLNAVAPAFTDRLVRRYGRAADAGDGRMQAPVSD